MSNYNERLVTRLSGLRQEMQELCVSFVGGHPDEKIARNPYQQMMAQLRKNIYDEATKMRELVEQAEKHNDKIVQMRREMR